MAPGGGLQGVVGYAILQEKQRLIALAERTRLMAVVENLDEWVLDYLAVELRAPAYEDSFPIEVKRELIAGTLPFYAKLGTPKAINWATQTIFGGSQMQEWFEYGGEPYHFRLDVLLGEDEWSSDKHQKMRWAIELCKNLRSRLEALNYHFPPAVLENRQAFYFVNLSLHAHANNLGEGTTCLNGARRLDGSWKLSPVFVKGVKLARFAWQVHAVTPQKNRAALLFRARAPNVNLGTVQLMCRTAERNRQGLRTGFYFSASARNMQAVEASVTAQRKHTLSGTFQLNGSKKLNAGTERSEL